MSGRRGRPLPEWLSVVALALGLGLAVLYVYDPMGSGGQLAYGTCGLLVLASIAVGLLVQRPQPSGPFVLMGSGVACSVAAAIVTATSDSQAAAALSGLLYLGVYACIGGGLLWLTGLREGHRAGPLLADALCVALAGWIPTWVFLMQPTIERSEWSAPVAVLQAAYQPLATVILFLTIRLIIARSLRFPSFRFFSAALLLSLLGDLAWSLTEAGWVTVDADEFSVLYVLAFALLSGAMLHPSLRALSDRHQATRRGNPTVRTALLGLCLLVPVVVFTIEPFHGPLDRVVRAVSSTLLVAVVAWRLIGAMRAHERDAEELLFASLHDPLTALPNRRHLVERLTEDLHTAFIRRRRSAALFVDLDRFKQINDTLGHEAGDHALRIAAERLGTSTGNGSYVGRIAGDEFVVVIPVVADEAEALGLADDLLAAVEQPIRLAGNEVFITASIGVALSPAAMSIDAEELVRNADMALYKAKQSGRNASALFDDSMRDELANRLDIEGALRRALERFELVVHHQPVVDLATGSVRGFEALVRWQRDGRGLVPPNEFIGVAEETGMIVELGTFVLDQALTDLRGWIDAGLCPPDTVMSVNLSARQLRDDRVVGAVRRALDRVGMAPGNLCLEVTETAVIAEPAAALSALSALRALGVHVALDDFGTGFSSLAYLSRYPIDRIKIDRSFVDGVATRDHDRVLVQAICSLGHDMGKQLVAEGIEDQAQLAALRQMGCDEAQGFFFARPVPAAQIPAVLEDLRARLSLV